MARTKHHQEQAAEPTTASTTADVGEANEEIATGVEIVPRSTTAVTNLTDVGNILLDDAEQAQDEFEKGDVALSFLRILQSNSPQVKRMNAKYVDGAEEGSFFNAATSRVYDGQKGIHVVPVHFTRQATLWEPRSETGAGKFVGEIPLPEAEQLLTQCVKNDKKKDITPNGLELTIAWMYYMLLFDREDPSVFEAVAYPMQSTQIKKARSWNAIIANSRLPHPSGAGSFRPPMFGFAYHLTTVPEQNSQGSWMGVKVTQWSPLIKYDGETPKEQFPGAAQLYLAARDLKQLVAEGRVKTKAEDLHGEEVEGGKNDEDDDMPF